MIKEEEEDQNKTTYWKWHIEKKRILVSCLCLKLSNKKKRISESVFFSVHQMLFDQ
jgi:hypothetical protein